MGSSKLLSWGRFKGKFKDRGRSPSSSPAPATGRQEASSVRGTTAASIQDDLKSEGSHDPPETSTPLPTLDPKPSHTLLHLVSPTKDEDQADIDIIAIPGLDTRSPETWTWKPRNKGRLSDGPPVNWLTDSEMLPAVAGSSRIFTCDWPSSLFVPTDTFERTVQGLARVLLLNIHAKRAENPDRPALFIASCLGGIILIQALVFAAREGREYKSLWNATKGIVFLATPFRGTAFQNLAAVAIPSLRAYGKLTGRALTELIDSVGKSTRSLEELARAFTDVHKLRDRDRDGGPQLAIFYETKKSNLLSKVPGLSAQVAEFFHRSELLVDATSACLDIVSHPLSLTVPHVLMNKFPSPDDPNYQLVSEKIRWMLLTIRGFSSPNAADNYIRERHYTPERLQIERISGDCLPMDTCYINLALIQHSDPLKGARDESDMPKSSPFSYTSRLMIETPDKSRHMELVDLFNPREIQGAMVNPRRILIQGRAGVGKTTLCKKIIFEFLYNNMWSKLYDRVLWVPLRNLRTREAAGYNLGKLFFDEYFSQCPNGKTLAKDLFAWLEESTANRTLFLLDGLDEATDLKGMDTFLAHLLSQPNCIVTMRPQAKSSGHFQSTRKPDLELETVGFQREQVNDYLEATMPDAPDKVKVKDMKLFLTRNPLLHGLVRIPIQLDAFCFTWDESSDMEDSPQTMTDVYCAIENKLWKKDIPRLGLGGGNNVLQATSTEVKSLITSEVKLLETFGFAGLYSNIVEFNWKHQEMIQDKVKYKRAGLYFTDVLSRLSFLRTSDSSQNRRQRSYHFIHLTFQEYFAAQHFARHWPTQEALHCVDLCAKTHEALRPHDFLQRHKYNSRYDIFWRFVSGLLYLGLEKDYLSFFKALEQEPVDLLGPSHQRLIMHCLNEAGQRTGQRGEVSKLRAKLEERLLQWLYLECNYTGKTYLARETEFPNKVLERALKEGSRDQRRITVEALRYRAYLSELLEGMLMALLQDTDLQWNDKNVIISLLQKQPNLSEATVNLLLELMKDEDGYEDGYSKAAKIAAEVLTRSNLPATAVNQLLAMLEDAGSKVQEQAIKMLAIQSGLTQFADAKLRALLATNPRILGSMLKDRWFRFSTLVPIPDAFIDPLFELLESPDRETQKAARTVISYRLPHNLEMRISAVIALLKHPDMGTRDTASWLISQQPQLSKTTVDALITLVNDPDIETRKYAALAMCNKSDLSETRIDALVVLLKDPDAHIRDAAVEAIRRQSSLPQTIFNTLIALLKDPAEGAQEAATLALESHSSLQKHTFNALIARLKDPDLEMHEAITLAILRQPSLPETIIDTLVALLKDPDTETRKCATWATSGQSILPETILDAFIVLLKDPDLEIRDAAAWGIQRQYSLPETIIETLTTLLLKDPDIETRRYATLAISGQSSLPETTLDALIELLKDRKRNVRSAVVAGLQHQSSLPEAIINTLATLLKEPDIETRGAAASIITSQHSLSETTINALVMALEDLDSFKQSTIIRKIRRHQYTLSETTTNTMIELLKDPDLDLQEDAMDAIRYQSSPLKLTIKPLVELLKHSNAHTRQHAASVIDYQSSHSSLPETEIDELIGLLKDPFLDKTVRRIVTTGLKSQGRRMLREAMTNPATLLSYSDEMISILYRCLVLGGFQAHFSWCFDFDRCSYVLYREDGERSYARFNNQSKLDHVMGIVDSVREQLAEVGACKDRLWDDSRRNTNLGDT